MPHTSGLWFGSGSNILTLRERFRMLDDSLMAEMFGVVLDGVTDGGQQNITKIYVKYDDDDAAPVVARERVGEVLEWISPTSRSRSRISYESGAPVPHVVCCRSACLGRHTVGRTWG